MKATATQQLLDSIHTLRSYARVTECLHRERFVNLKGAVGSLKSLMLVNLLRDFSAQILYVTSDSMEAEGIKDDVELLAGEPKAAFFPASSFHGVHLTSKGAMGPRLGAMELLATGSPGIVVAHHSGLEKGLPPVQDFNRKHLSVSVGQSLDFQEWVGELIELGFARESRVENPGEMSVRGGIVDLFPASAEAPYRIEFWGDDVESIRKFDPASQRSTEKAEQVDIFSQDFDALAGEGDAHNSSLLDYLGSDAIVVLNEPDVLRKNLVGPANADGESELPEAPASEDPFWSDVMASASQLRHLHLVSLGQHYPNLVALESKTQDAFKGNLKLFRKNLKDLNSKGLDGHTEPPDIFYVCENSAQAGRLEEIFIDEEVMTPNLKVVALGLHKGFVFPEANLVVYTDHEFYGRSKRLRLPKGTPKGLTPRQLKRLHVGDYVVHVDFGIAVFRGLKKIMVQNHERECLHLEYKDGDKVYVRVERMDRVYKYSAKEGAAPPLNKLGSPDWQKLKSRTKKKLKDMAKDLIEIYAKRKSQPGYAFSPDSLWQRELEASFPYDDTPDQVKATFDVKADMESSQPMDRLVCGDVGFGKTEIAVRAAFKAVLGNKQVAMLVPTTILAHQHYNTFRDRLERFPVNVEMLSRFRTAGEQKRIVARIKSGDVDVVIGTHRLLSKDVEFKNLGLLIVDEEQRFGVRHKERLKQFRATVDVLTLTATPIPRTLQFSLMGARDMTNIDTPPKNRLPIITEILTFNKHYIREAILRELDRGGQVFFVHNRVRSIDRIARMLSGLVPEANIAVAHGQMQERELEKVIISFMQRKYQILVSTMIIESGMDMPNVNTIIVNRADKLGLAQLYQLRGRVGRSHQRAYAYLLIPPIETLTDDAIKRLRAVEEFTELGSGTRLAMRDLEIRGAGNLLGAEQTGFINSLGFELYNKTLDQAIKELKQEKLSEAEPKPELETQVDMDHDAYLPDDYIQSGSERVDIYQRLIDAKTTAQLDEIGDELADRFGRMPGPVRNLLHFLGIRVLAPELGFKQVRIMEGMVEAEFAEDFLDFKQEPFKKWLGSIVANAPQPIEFFQDKTFGIRIAVPEQNGALSFARNFLQELSTNIGWTPSEPEHEAQEAGIENEN